MSDGPTHRRISRVIAAPATIGLGILTDDWPFAIFAGAVCFLSGCGPDNADQAEARLSLGWETVGCLGWIVGVLSLLWWLKDALAP